MAKQAPEPTPQIESDAEKPTPPDKPNATVGKQKRPEAEKAQDEREAADADSDEARKTNGGADKQRRPTSEADRTGRGRPRDGTMAPEFRLDAKNETEVVEQIKEERVRADDEFEKASKRLLRSEHSSH